MKSVKSKILLGMTTAAMLVCFSFGATACKKDKGGDKEKLSTPTNIVIVQETATVTWDEVEGAVEYTVKINSDETTVVSETTYVLTTDTSKLKDGDNTVSVKANATDNNAASDYSTTVTYVYDATPAFATPAAPTVSGREVSWAAVEGAEGYTVKIGEKEYPAESNSFDIETIMDELVDKTDYEISVKVNATSAHKASAYSEAASYTHVLTAQEAAASFIKSVNAIDETVTADSKAEIELARQKHDALSEEAKAIDGVDEAITKLAGKECDYFAVLVDAIEVDDLDKTITKEEKEAVDAAIETATTYYENLIDQTGAEATNTAYGEKKSAYNTLITAIEADVEAIEDAIEELNLTGEITQTGKELLEYYETLNTIQTNIDGLVGYAASILDSELKTAVETEIEAVLKAVYKTEDNVEAFVNGANGTVTILCKAVNVEGEVLKGDAPSLTVTIDDGTDGGVNTEGAAFINNDGVYYYTVNFTKKAGDDKTDNGYELKVTYTIGGGAEQEVKYIEFKDDIYFTAIPAEPKPDDYFAIKDGKITFSGADNEAYFDIYQTKDISIGADNNSDPVITGFPLLKEVVVKNGTSVEDFRRQLARNEEYAKILSDNNYTVRFVVYNKAVNGGITISNIKNSLVSHDTYLLDLTADDAKQPIDSMSVFDFGVWPGTGNFSLVTDAQVPAFVPQFNGVINGVTVDADNVGDYLQIKITAYDKNDQAGANPLFSKAVPFKNQAYDYFSYMKEWAIYYFANGGADNTKVNFYLTLTIQLKEEVNGQPNPFAKAFKDSESKPVTVQNDYTGEYTFEKADVTLPTDMLFSITNEPIFFPGFKCADDFINKHVSHLELHFRNSTDESVYNTAYLVYNADNENFVLLKNLNDAVTSGCAFGKGGNEYYATGSVLEQWIKDNYGDTTFALRGEGWYFRTQLIDNDKDGAYLFGDGKSAWTTFFTPQEPVTPDPDDKPVPTGNQIGLTEDGNGIITFMLTGTDGNEGEGHRGWVLYHGANYIVVKFHVNSEDTEGHLAYLIPDMIHPEAGLKMYTNANGTGTALNCGTVVNGWVHIYDSGDGNAFTKWIVEVYDDINEGDFNINQASFYTSIYSDGNGNYVAGDGTTFGAAVTWEDRVIPETVD